LTCLAHSAAVASIGRDHRSIRSGFAFCVQSVESVFHPYSQLVDASPSGSCRFGQGPRDSGINNLEIRIERIERMTNGSKRCAAMGQCPWTASFPWLATEAAEVNYVASLRDELTRPCRFQSGISCL
jgi:hypothetical protein